jgi:hypothetical protein
MEAQAKMTYMNPYRAVFCGAISGGLAEDRGTDMALGERVEMAVCGVFRQVDQQSGEVRRLLKGSGANDALHQLPPRICLQFGSGQKGRERIVCH